MIILTVDFAAKFSAGLVRGHGGEVHSQFDSLDKSSFDFLELIVEHVNEYSPDIILIEDVPYGISSQAMTKPVLRLQGSLILALRHHLDKVYFLNPSTWQKEFLGVARGKPAERVEAARMHAERLGYSPPDLVEAYKATVPEGKKILKKNTDPLAKVMTDYIDAFLMSEWAMERNGDFNISGVQQVYT